MLLRHSSVNLCHREHTVLILSGEIQQLITLMCLLTPVRRRNNFDNVFEVMLFPSRKKSMWSLFPGSHECCSDTILSLLLWMTLRYIQFVRVMSPGYECIYIDIYIQSKRMTTIIFVDFIKSFDSIDRRAISIVLLKYGVSEFLIANVMQFYIGTSAVVATTHGSTVSLNDIWCSSRWHTDTFPLHHPTWLRSS